jgi:hypothetical protein
MTERNITGDASRSKYKAAKKLADELGVTDQALEKIAEGVREFDAQRSVEQRTAAAVEKIAANTTPPGSSGNNWPWEEQRLRRREVQALELLAVLPVATDEEVAKIQAGAVYRRIIARLSTDDPSSVRFDPGE